MQSEQQRNTLYIVPYQELTNHQLSMKAVPGATCQVIAAAATVAVCCHGSLMHFTLSHPSLKATARREYAAGHVAVSMATAASAAAAATTAVCCHGCVMRFALSHPGLEAPSRESTAWFGARSMATCYCCCRCHCCCLSPWFCDALRSFPSRP